jgi:phospholipase C
MTIFRRTIATMLTGILATGPLFAAHPAKPVQPQDAIRHVVIIFQENISFDHYFGTYPHAANLPGEPQFTALPNTPAVNGLSGELLTANPNATNTDNGQGAANPFRLNRDQAVTADQSHNYRAEQMAYDNGKMDLFPKSVGSADGPKIPGVKTGVPSTTGLTMGYFDGNTVTAFWNYAQHFAMSDNHFNTGFGPSTPGVINLISGQTNGAINDQNSQGDLVADGNGGQTLIGDADPAGDVCNSTSDALVHMAGPNIGDKLSAANITWGFFEGGFDLTVVNPNGTTGCRRSTIGLSGQNKRDYVPHHQGFQYYPSTANPQHTRPSSVAAIGTNHDGANHQYDTHDFFDAVKAGNFPAVSYLKAPAYQDGHAGSSDPLDEQTFVVNTINALQQSPEWDHTAVLIAYDDSDGWYDHVMGKIMNASTSKSDALTAPGQCGDGSSALPGVDPATAHAQGRCGFGPRLPLIIVSPWAKANFVDHSLSDQTSILRFVEDLFLNGQRLGAGSFDVQAGSLNPMFDFSQPKPKNGKKLILNPDTGLVQQGS